MAFAELDRVVFTRDLPEASLVRGDVGVIVHIYDKGWAYEVEVFSLTGATVVVVTAPADAIRPVDAHDVVSARIMAAE